MKIFSASQIREWDQYTIIHEPIKSLDLMERAADACFKWIVDNIDTNATVFLFCGNGNNGGDGLAIARMLAAANFKVEVFIFSADKRSPDCSVNLERLIASPIKIREIFSERDFQDLPINTLVIDALYGTGLNKPLEGLSAALVRHINSSGCKIISIDIPSGMFADATSNGGTHIQADETLSFQCPKLAFMLNENDCGRINILDIGLDQNFYKQTATTFSTIDAKLLSTIYRPRPASSHKYNFGHALLFAGSKNYMGAAILAAKACLRSGAGLVTVATQKENLSVIQTALPEAIASDESNLEKICQKKAAFGVGPGLTVDEVNSQVLHFLISQWDKPLVIDASALAMTEKCIPFLRQRINQPAVLTPHTGEFENLFGKSNNDFERIELAMEKAADINCIIVLKGHHTLVACPDGTGWFNINGNSGMATAGSGDVLTGLLTGLLAQGYPAKNAGILGVFLHGLAGDFAARKYSEEAMIAGDITEQFGEAYKTVKKMLPH